MLWCPDGARRKQDAQSLVLVSLSLSLSALCAVSVAGHVETRQPNVAAVLRTLQHISALVEKQNKPTGGIC